MDQQRTPIWGLFDQMAQTYDQVGRTRDLPPAHFDVIASSLVLFFLPEPAHALSRWVESVRPGGRVGITTFGQ
jgi:SAM-dependent methyltransferase